MSRLDLRSPTLTPSGMPLTACSVGDDLSLLTLHVNEHRRHAQAEAPPAARPTTLFDPAPVALSRAMQRRAALAHFEIAPLTAAATAAARAGANEETQSGGRATPDFKPTPPMLVLDDDSCEIPPQAKETDFVLQDLNNHDPSHPPPLVLCDSPSAIDSESHRSRRRRSPPALSLEGLSLAPPTAATVADGGGLASPGLMFDMDLPTPLPPPDANNNKTAESVAPAASAVAPPLLARNASQETGGGSTRSSVSFGYGSGAWASGDALTPERSESTGPAAAYSPLGPAPHPLYMPPAVRTRSCVLPVALKTNLNESSNDDASNTSHTHSDSAVYRSIRRASLGPAVLGVGVGRLSYARSRSMAAVPHGLGPCPHAMAPDACRTCSSELESRAESSADVERLEAAQWAALEFPPPPPLPMLRPIVAPSRSPEPLGSRAPHPSPNRDPHNQYFSASPAVSPAHSRQPLTPARRSGAQYANAAQLEAQQSLLNAALAERNAMGIISATTTPNGAAAAATARVTFTRSRSEPESHSPSPARGGVPSRRWNKSWMVDVECDLERELADAQAEVAVARASRELLANTTTSRHGRTGLGVEHANANANDDAVFHMDL